MLEYVMTWGWCMKLGLWDSLTVGHWDLRVGQILKHLSCEQKTYLKKKQCPSNLTIVTTQELNIWILIARSLWWTLFIPCAAFAKFPRPSTAGAMHLFDMVSVCVRGNACVIYRIWGQKKTKFSCSLGKNKGTIKELLTFQPHVSQCIKQGVSDWRRWCSDASCFGCESSNRRGLLLEF